MTEHSSPQPADLDNKVAFFDEVSLESFLGGGPPRKETVKQPSRGSKRTKGKTQPPTEVPSAVKNGGTPEKGSGPPTRKRSLVLLLLLVVGILLLALYWPRYPELGQKAVADLPLAPSPPPTASTEELASPPVTVPAAAEDSGQEAGTGSEGIASKAVLPTAEAPSAATATGAEASKERAVLPAEEVASPKAVSRAETAVTAGAQTVAEPAGPYFLQLGAYLAPTHLKGPQDAARKAGMRTWVIKRQVTLPWYRVRVTRWPEQLEGRSLDEVHKAWPDAFRLHTAGAIYLGSFVREDLARERAASFARGGGQARIVSVRLPRTLSILRAGRFDSREAAETAADLISTSASPLVMKRD